MRGKGDRHFVRGWTRKKEEGMEADDLLCSRNVRSRKARAWDCGTSQRASGWTGEKVARSGRPISPLPGEVTSELGGVYICERCSFGARTSRMLKKSASSVLASLRGSTYRSVRLASSLAAALMEGLFEHP